MEHLYTCRMKIIPFCRRRWLDSPMRALQCSAIHVISVYLLIIRVMVLNAEATFLLSATRLRQKRENGWEIVKQMSRAPSETYLEGNSTLFMNLPR